jgi:hypothetical protein
MRKLKFDPARRKVYICDLQRAMLSTSHEMWWTVKIPFTDKPRPDNSQEQVPPQGGALPEAGQGYRPGKGWDPGQVENGMVRAGDVNG